MSGSQQELCHSEGDQSQCSNYYSSNSNNKKVGSLWYSQTLDSLLEECEEKYGLKNAHPGNQMSQDHHHEHGNAEDMNETSLRTSYSCLESYESLSNKIKKQHESYRKVAKLLRNLQADLKKRNPKDFSNGNEDSVLNDTKQGNKSSAPGAVELIRDQWSFINRTRNATHIPTTMPLDGAKDGCSTTCDVVVNMTTIKCKSQATTSIPSMCPKGNKAEEGIPTTRESSIMATKSKLTGESVKNSSNSTTTTNTNISPIENNMTLTGEPPGTFPVTPPSYFNNLHEIKYYSQVPVGKKDSSRQYKMSSSLLQDLLGKPHNLNVQDDNNSNPISRHLPVSDTVEDDNFDTGKSSNYEDDAAEDFFSMFITLLDYSTSALKKLLTTSEVDEETRLKICEQAKEAQFQIGTLFGDPCVMGGQSELFRSNVGSETK